MKDKYYTKRWYDGEVEFVCSDCNARLIDHLFDCEDIPNPILPAAVFFQKQIPPSCPVCKYQNSMVWTGWSGDNDKSDSIVGALTQLIKSEYFMAACMVLASATEYYLNSLLYATLVDDGFSVEEASKMADGDRYNGEIVRTLRIVLRKQLKSFTLPYRNDIIHGKDFGEDKSYFKKVFYKNVKHLEEWVASFGIDSNYINPTEKERWFIHMEHFISYLNCLAT